MINLNEHFDQNPIAMSVGRYWQLSNIPVDLSDMQKLLKELYVQMYETERKALAKLGEMNEPEIWRIFSEYITIPSNLKPDPTKYYLLKK